MKITSSFGSRRRQVGALLVSLALLAISLPSQASATPSTVHLTIHYQRPGEDYKGWNLWLWKNVSGSSGDVDVNANGTEFNGDDAFGKVLKLDIPDMANFESVGFIVRLNAWQSKDVGDDRFVTNFDANGNATIWLIQGDKTVYTSAPTSNASIRSASIDGFRLLTVELSQKMALTGSGAEGFTLSDGNSVTSVKALNGTSTSASQVQLTLGADVVLGKTYTLSHPTFGKVETTPGKIMNSDGFNTRFTYAGNDLGNTYFTDRTDFRLWAPTATAVKLVTYAKADTSANEGITTPMLADQNGTWITTQKVNANGLIYNYRVTVGGVEREAVDPYVRATTINGTRGVVVDLSKTDPQGWSKKKPSFSGKGTDAVIYELHVRDLSMDASGNFPAAQKGKYSALSNMTAKTNAGGLAGVAAIKDLGATHVELLPVFDYASVDEANPTFNWGYDPQNYNVPEGSYSSDPRNPTARIVELKSAIQSLHDNNLRVMMDVVYNHVFSVSSFSQENIVPGYFFRTNSDGTLTNGSGVGNDVASERPMVRKFIVDSVKYWATQYRLDGFRFDLMGLIDLTTMQQIRMELTKIDPSILIIGEGWDMGTLPAIEKSTQQNIGSLVGISAFNDQLRDGIKGSVFDATDTGYATGKLTQITSTKAGIVGNVFYSRDVLGKWITTDPTQSVNYVESHDNLTLFDKLTASVPNAPTAKIDTLDRFATSIAFLAQGVPFMQAGQEFLRSKNGDSNSYRSSDAINSLKWDLRGKNIATVNYYKGLLALRKAHPAFRMSTTTSIQKNLTFLKASNDVIAYSLNGSAVKDSWKSIVVVHNPNSTSQKIALPSKGNWSVVVNEKSAGVKVIKTLKATSKITVAGLATTVLQRVK
ncbi:MAG: type I pullulanase [Actinobacteria bacterium]|nr:type I pullulanase [Actinomycetota bacterium]